MPPNPTRNVWKEEINDLIRGASGGFLFGIPLIYTMEIWWIGSYTEPPLMLTVLAATFVVVFLLNRTDGFRQLHPDRSIKAAMDSVEALAIGIVCTTLVLILLQEVTLETSLEENLGKIIFEGIPFAIGVALARSILSGENGRNEENSQSNRNNFLSDIGATLIGAIFIAFNIAPTDEISMLAAAVSPPWLLIVIAASLLISYGIVFVAGFTTQERRIKHQGLFQRPLTNLGGNTAESVQIIGEIRVNGQVEQSGEQQIDYLSANEKQEGAFVFTRDPREGDLIVRVGSYKLP